MGQKCMPNERLFLCSEKKSWGDKFMVMNFEDFCQTFFMSRRFVPISCRSSPLNCIWLSSGVSVFSISFRLPFVSCPLRFHIRSAFLSRILPHATSAAWPSARIKWVASRFRPLWWPPHSRLTSVHRLAYFLEPYSTKCLSENRVKVSEIVDTGKFSTSRFHRYSVFAVKLCEEMIMAKMKVSGVFNLLRFYLSGFEDRWQEGCQEEGHRSLHPQGLVWHQGPLHVQGPRCRQDPRQPHPGYQVRRPSWLKKQWSITV